MKNIEFKDNLCKQKNIILYRIKEYDWNKNKEKVKDEIKKLIEST